MFRTELVEPLVAAAVARAGLSYVEAARRYHDAAATEAAGGRFARAELLADFATICTRRAADLPESPEIVPNGAAERSHLAPENGR